MYELTWPNGSHVANVLTCGLGAHCATDRTKRQEQNSDRQNLAFAQIVAAGVKVSNALT